MPEFVEAVPPPEGPAQGNWLYLRDERGGAWHQVERDPVGGEWALGIAVAAGFTPTVFYDLGDYFIFHPSGVYSKEAYGGMLQRIWNWGYYKE